MRTCDMNESGPAAGALESTPTGGGSIVISHRGQLRAATVGAAKLIRSMPDTDLISIPPPGPEGERFVHGGRTYKVASTLYVAKRGLHDDRIEWLKDQASLSEISRKLRTPRDLKRSIEVVLWQESDAPVLREFYMALTPRLQQVLDLVLSGHSNKSLARNLNIETQTTKQYVRRVCEILGVRNREELFAAALANFGFRPHVYRPILHPRHLTPSPSQIQETRQ